MSLVDLDGNPKTEKIPLSQKFRINLSKYSPNYILKKITTNICSDWKNNGKERILHYIRDYEIDWKEAQKCFTLKSDSECAKKFSSKNEFFQRELHPSIFQIDYTKNAIVSPADCRMVIYRDIESSKKYWIKGEEFSKAQLLSHEELSKKFNGPIVICRLAPVDYHRFHFPINCKYVTSYKIDGKYLCVDKRIVNSKINPIGENKREVHLLYHKKLGYIAFVVIGATCVGSIEIDLVKNKKYRKGDFFGKFGFGGSTIVMLFAKDFNVKKNIVDNSLHSIETYVRVGNSIGNYNI
jgi:phosphatidylserine decarboxylase